MDFDELRNMVADMANETKTSAERRERRRIISKESPITSTTVKKFLAEAVAERRIKAMPEQIAAFLEASEMESEDSDEKRAEDAPHSEKTKTKPAG